MEQGTLPTEVKPMKYIEVNQEVAPKMFSDPMWVAEQKLDGTRALVRVTRDGVLFTQNGTGQITHAAAALHFGKLGEALKRLGGDTPYWLDGEVMFDTGQLWVFDLPIPFVPFSERREELVRWGQQLDPEGPVQVVRQETTEEGKAALFEEVRDHGGEGLILKHLEGVYESGKRVSSVCKVKFVKTADVVVTNSSRGRNAAGREVGAFSFAVYDEVGQLRNLGSCSAIGKPHVEIGDVIEVAYLYYTGGLVQPRMVRVRKDKFPEQCGFDQFPAYSKAVRV